MDIKVDLRAGVWLHCHNNPLPKSRDRAWEVPDMHHAKSPIGAFRGLAVG